METVMSFPELLRKYRLRCGWSPETLAAVCRLEPKTIRDIESQKHHPHPKSIKRLADALQLSEVEREDFISAALSPAPTPAAPIPRSSPTRSAPSSHRRFPLYDPAIPSFPSAQDLMGREQMLPPIWHPTKREQDSGILRSDRPARRWENSSSSCCGT